MLVFVLVDLHVRYSGSLNTCVLLCIFYGSIVTGIVAWCIHLRSVLHQEHNFKKVYILQQDNHFQVLAEGGHIGWFRSNC